MHVKLDFLIRIFLRPQDKIGLVQRKFATLCSSCVIRDYLEAEFL